MGQSLLPKLVALYRPHWAFKVLCFFSLGFESFVSHPNLRIKQILRFLKNIYSTRVVFFSCINFWMQVFVFNAVGFYGHLKANGLLGYMPIPSSQGLFHRLVTGCPMLDLIWAFKVLCFFILGFWAFRLRTTKHICNLRDHVILPGPKLKQLFFFLLWNECLRRIFSKFVSEGNTLKCY